MCVLSYLHVRRAGASALRWERRGVHVPTFATHIAIQLLFGSGAARWARYCPCQLKMVYVGCTPAAR